MPWNKYPNLTEDDLVAILESIQRRSTIGEIGFVTVAGGGQMSRSWQFGRDVSEEAKRVVYALFKLNPSTWDNPYAQRIRRTLPVYS
jgi:hypothetical protein